VNAHGARRSYERAADSAHAEIAPLAALELGILFEEDLDDADSARVAYRRAVDSRDSEAAPRAAAHLALMLAGADPRAALAAAHELIADEHVPYAAYQLAVLCARRQDPPGAAVAYQAAIDSGDPDVAPAAALGLAALLDRHGDAEAAQSAVDTFAALTGSSFMIRLGRRTPTKTRRLPARLRALRSRSMLDARAHARDCDDMARALNPPHPLVSLIDVTEWGVAFGSVAYALTEDGPAGAAIALRYCPLLRYAAARADGRSRRRGSLAAWRAVIDAKAEDGGFSPPVSGCPSSLAVDGGVRGRVESCGRCRCCTTGHATSRCPTWSGTRACA
jgi:hypothetical protein